MNVFELKSSSEQFEFVFNVMAHYYETKEFGKLNDFIDFCLNNVDGCTKNPSIPLSILVCTKGMNKELPNRVKLHELTEKIYSEKYKGRDKDLKLVIMGLK